MYIKRCDVIIHPNRNPSDGLALMYNFIPQNTNHVITYPYPDLKYTTRL